MIFDNPKSEAAQALTELEQAVLDTRRSLRELQAEHQQARTQHNEVKERLTEAYASGKEAKKLEGQVRDLGRELDDHWPPRLEGARRAEERARFDRDRLISDNFEEIAAELAPDCIAARDNIEAAITALRAGLGEWENQAHRMEQVMRCVPGVRGLDVPYFPVNALHQELGHIESRVPLPMPRELWPREDEEEGDDEEEEAA